MSDILVRGLDAVTVNRLKATARRNGRSLQSEAKLLLERAVGTGDGDVARIFEKWDARFKGRKFSGSVDMIREDRER